MGKRRTQLFLKESVVFFGFLNGLFLALGVSPGAALLDVLRAIVENLVGESGWIALLFTLLPVALLGLALYFIHKRGGWLGFVAVGCAFIAGLWVLAEPGVGAAMLAAAVVLGVVATR